MILKIERNGRTTDLLLRKHGIPNPVLIRFSAHVAYAIESFSAYSLLAAFFGDHPRNSAMRGTDNWWKGQALLRSYLVAAREIETFLYPEITAHLSRHGFENPTIDLGAASNRDTVTSFDYVEDPEDWLRSRPKRDPRMDGIRRRINETVVHFDLSRLDNRKDDGRDARSSKQTWTVAEPWNYLRPTLAALAHCIDSTRVTEEFPERLQLSIEGRATELDSVDFYPFLVDPGSD